MVTYIRLHLYAPKAINVFNNRCENFTYLTELIIYGIIILEFSIWGGISSDIRSEILFHGGAEP